ncbi:MAG: putative glycoside hydrolase [Bacillota bacterium]
MPGPAEIDRVVERVSQERGRTIRGLYVPVGVARDSARLDRLIDLVLATELNAMVIDLKDDNGWVAYDSALDSVNVYSTKQPRLGELEELAGRLDELGIYAIARLVVFKDSRLAAARPDLAVQHRDGGLWRDRTGTAWLDPHSREAWQYCIDIAVEVAEAGFPEVQFDYVRFPTDGAVSSARYTWADEGVSGADVITAFLEEAQWALAGVGAASSVDVFGLVTTVTDDMRIGQNWERLVEVVDYISPMVYPSHYGPNIYGLPVPNEAPYETVWHAMRDALERTTDRDAIIRPWLQDFSWGYRYGPAEVRGQIDAAYEWGIDSWLLWNAGGVYTRGALLDEEDEE